MATAPTTASTRETITKVAATAPFFCQKPADEEVSMLVDVWEGEGALDVCESVGKRLFEISRVVAGVSRRVESAVYGVSVAVVGVKVELVELVNGEVVDGGRLVEN